MALESLLDTPSPLVSKGNNDRPTDKPVNESSKDEKLGGAGDVADAELEDGEIEDDDEEEQETDEDSLDAEEKKRRKRRIKNKERRKRKQSEKRLQQLQAWAMAMAAGEIDNDEEEEEDEAMDDEFAQEDEQPYVANNEPILGPPPLVPSLGSGMAPVMASGIDPGVGSAGSQGMGPDMEMEEDPENEQFLQRTYPPGSKKKKRKRKRVPSPDESSEGGYDDLLRKEMSRHQLKRRSSESSNEGRIEGGESDAGEYSDEDEVHRHRKKKKKKHRHSRHHRSSKKSSTPKSKSKSKPRDCEEDFGNHDEVIYLGEDAARMQGGDQQHQSMRGDELSEQDYHMAMQEQEGKVHIPKTHLICKFFLENKCKKGLDCLYTHEGSIPKRPEQCKFYLQGYCQKGPLCMFLHQEYPCKYYHTGQVCYAGDKCRFSHAAPTEDLKPIIASMMDETDETPQHMQSPPRREPNVPFQKGTKGGGRPSAPPGSIPSLFELDVKPVGAKGQKILEKERQDALENERHRKSEDDAMHSHGPNQGDERSFFGSEGGSNYGEGHRGHQEDYDSSPYNGPRGQGYQGQRYNGPRFDGPNFDGPRFDGPRMNQRSYNAPPAQPPLLPLPEGLTPLRMPMPPPLPQDGPTPPQEPKPQSTKKEPAKPSNAAPLEPHPQSLSSPQRISGGAFSHLDSIKSETDEKSSSSELEIVYGSTEKSDSDRTESSQDKKEVTNSTASTNATNDAANESKEATISAPPVVIEPPVKMPAQSKALFMRIQQKEAKKNLESAATDEDPETKVSTGVDESWYSSDEEETKVKNQNVTMKAIHSNTPQGPAGQTDKQTNSQTPAYAAGLLSSDISPSTSNQGPLVSSALLASNKSQNEHEAPKQSQLPGPLASLFTKSQSSTTSSATAVAPSNPLPLNLLELVTKGSSSVQNSMNPQAQNLLKGLLPSNANQLQSSYRLLECIRDPVMKDPRDGRQRKTKIGMLFRMLKWKDSEYSVHDKEDRPSLPPIELHTPTELKSPPHFPVPPQKTLVDPRTQIVVDALKKFIVDSTNTRPVDPRQRPKDPRTQSTPPQGLPPMPFPPPPERMPMSNSGMPAMPNMPPFGGRGPMGPQGGFQNRPRMPHRMPFPQRPPRMQNAPRMQNPPLLSDPRYPGQMRPPRPRGPGRGYPLRPPRPGIRPPFSSPPNLGDGMPMQHQQNMLRGPQFNQPPPSATPPQDPRNSRPAATRPDPRLAPSDRRLAPSDPRPAPSDPRLARRNSAAAQGGSDVDMRTSKDPRLARLHSNPSGGTSQQASTQKQPSADVDMRVPQGSMSEGQAPPQSGFSTYTNNGTNNSGLGRGRPRDPRQGPTSVNMSGDVDLRQGPTLGIKAPVPPEDLVPTEMDISMKDMFKGKDPTASPFL